MWLPHGGRLAFVCLTRANSTPHSVSQTGVGEGELIFAVASERVISACALHQLASCVTRYTEP